MCRHTTKREKNTSVAEMRSHAETVTADIAPPSLSTDGHQYLDLPLQTAVKNAWRYIGR